MSAPAHPRPTLALLRAQREAILALCQRYGASQVRVFGSVARDEATPDSDVDLLVRFGPGASLYDLAGLRRELVELLGFEVDVVSEHPRMRESFRQLISPDLVPL